MLDSLENNMKELTGKEGPLKKSLLEGGTGFFTEENLQAAAEKGIEVLTPDPQFRQRDPYFAEKKKEKVPKKETFTQDDFIYNEKNDTYACPGGRTLEYKCKVKLRTDTGKRCSARTGGCRNCPLRDKCIKARTGGKNTKRALFIADQKYEENLSSKMRGKIDNPVYRELYSKRMQIIEPVYSNITYCKGMNRFTLRGKKKVSAQWKLYCMVHYIGKCIKPLAVLYGT